jgi:chemotaxis protein MotB
MPVFEEEHKCEEFTDFWIFTYGDLVTLLLVFFIMLFSFCKTDTSKLKSVAESFKPTPPGSPFFFEGRESVLQSLARQIQTSELGQEVFVTVDRRGVVVSFKDTALFPAGSADLTDAAHKTLRTFTAYLFGLPNDIIIEGHTDDTPISTSRFPSNWELSAARAAAVARYFQSQGVKGQRMEVIGYGEYRPRFRNDTPAKRALNRRIDVVLKPE